MHLAKKERKSRRGSRVTSEESAAGRLASITMEKQDMEPRL
jgi:hypothetical protein